MSPEGAILKEWSVPELLRKNDLNGLYYLGYIHAVPHETVRNDRLHLNDVEPFPKGLAPGFFGEGDVLVSLRNINTVLVFNQQTEHIKYITTGRFIRQHDPDFVDGDSFTVFDNNDRPFSEPDEASSRIVLVNARTGAMKTLYEGTPEHPFFTSAMGKQQWLPNGNLLITEATKGRAFEVTPDGQIVWQYVNYVDDHTISLVEEAQRLPMKYRKLFDDGAREDASHTVTAWEPHPETNMAGLTEFSILSLSLPAGIYGLSARAMSAPAPGCRPSARFCAGGRFRGRSVRVRLVSDQTAPPQSETRQAARRLGGTCCLE